MILSRKERSGEYFLRVCAEEFQWTSDKVELLDLPIMGGK